MWNAKPAIFNGNIGRKKSDVEISGGRIGHSGAG
jgi:hypothetical protein